MGLEDMGLLSFCGEGPIVIWLYTNQENSVTRHTTATGAVLTFAAVCGVQKAFSLRFLK